MTKIKSNFKCWKTELYRSCKNCLKVHNEYCDYEKVKKFEPTWKRNQCPICLHSEYYNQNLNQCETCIDRRTIPNSPLNDHDYKAVVNLYESGASINKIATTFGFSFSIAKKIIELIKFNQNNH